MSMAGEGLFPRLPACEDECWFAATEMNGTLRSIRLSVVELNDAKNSGSAACQEFPSHFGERSRPYGVVLECISIACTMPV